MNAIAPHLTNAQEVAMSNLIVALAGINTRRPAPTGRPVGFTLHDGTTLQAHLLPQDAGLPQFALLSMEEKETLAWWLNSRHWSETQSRH